MNIHRLPLQAAFSLDCELPREQYVDGLRPTISVFVRSLKGEVLLVCPIKAEEHQNAYMFPQGPINRHELPRAAAARILQQECMFTEEMIEIDQAFALGISPIDSQKDVTKTHHVVFLSLRKRYAPMLNHENRSHLFVSGPNYLWSKISGCRPQKRRMIVTSIFSAVQANLLLTKRWNLDRLQNLRNLALA